RIQPLWIDDAAAYFAQSVDRPEAANRLFELGGPDAVSWNEVWSQLKRAPGPRPPSIHLPTTVMRVKPTAAGPLPRNIPPTRHLLTMLEDGDNVTSNDDAERTFKLPLVPLDEQLQRATS